MDLQKLPQPSYTELVTAAVESGELKKQHGPSLAMIKKFVVGRSGSRLAGKNALKTVRVMVADGRLVKGAQKGKKGAGCYKLASKETRHYHKKNLVSRRNYWL